MGRPTLKANMPPVMANMTMIDKMFGDADVHLATLAQLGGQGPVALLGPVTLDMHAAIRAGAQTLAWMTGVFCVVRGLPVLVEGWRFLSSNLSATSAGEEARGDAG